jgi:hypothetical protein
MLPLMLHFPHICHAANERLCHIDELDNIESYSITYDCFDFGSSHDYSWVIAHSFIIPKTKTNKDLEEDEHVSMAHAIFNIECFGA